MFWLFTHSQKTPDFFDRINFVVPNRLYHKGSGDARLATDLAHRLAAGIDLPYTVSRTPIETPNTMHIVINSDERKKPPSEVGKEFVHVCIENDILQAGRGFCDFLFRQKYAVSGMVGIRNALNIALFEPKAPYGARLYAPETLPSRITRETLAKGKRRHHFYQKNIPTIVMCVRRDIAHTAQSIRHFKQHNKDARIFVVGGPTIDNADFASNKFNNLQGVTYIPWQRRQGFKNHYLGLFDAATHFVTSGTLSTTSDMLATGKPVYYIPEQSELRLCDESFKDRLIKLGHAGIFTPHILDEPLSPHTGGLCHEWEDTFPRQFARDLKQLIEERTGGKKSIPLVPQNTRLRFKGYALD